MYVKRVGLIQKMRNISEQLTGYRFVMERNVLTQSSICLIEGEQDTRELFKNSFEIQFL